MMVIHEKTIRAAWLKTVHELKKAALVPNVKFLADEPAVITISDPLHSERNDERFPISQHDMDIINRYLITGEREHDVVHEWTKLYYQRLFQEKGNQIQKVIEYLKKSPRV